MSKLSILAAGSVIAATAAFGGASVALADGYSAKKPKVAYERPSDWSGVYFGVQSGYQWSNINAEFTTFGTTFDVTHDSGIVGVQVGLQHQFGQVVLGVEGNWLSTFRDDPGVTSCPNPAFDCTNRLNDILTIGGRIGYAAGHWMPYVTGGYASGRFEYKSITVATGAFFDQASARHDGWYIGGGFEWIVSPGWTVGLEYRHYEFDEAAAPAFFSNGTGPNPASDQLTDASVDSITARVSWKWGREPVRPLK